MRKLQISLVKMLINEYNLKNETLFEKTDQKIQQKKYRTIEPVLTCSTAVHQCCVWFNKFLCNKFCLIKFKNPFNL